MRNSDFVSMEKELFPEICAANYNTISYYGTVFYKFLSYSNEIANDSSACLGAIQQCSHLTMEKIGNLSQTISLFSVFKLFILIINESPKRFMKEKRISFNLIYFILLYLWYSCREVLLLSMLADCNCVPWPVTSTYLLKKYIKFGIYR